MDTSFTVNTALTPYPGDLLWKVKWKEGSKEIIFMVSHSLDYRDGNGFDVLFARRFVKNGKYWTPAWAYRDTVRGFGCDIDATLLPEFCRVTDANEDGKKEVFFTYYRNNRCDAVVVETRLVANQHNIGGQIEGMSQLYLGPIESIMNEILREQGEPEISYKAIKPDLEAMGKDIQDYASKLWDEMLKWQDAHQND